MVESDFLNGKEFSAMTMSVHQRVVASFTLEEAERYLGWAKGLKSQGRPCLLEVHTLERLCFHSLASVRLKSLKNLDVPFEFLKCLGFDSSIRVRTEARKKMKSSKVRFSKLNSKSAVSFVVTKPKSDGKRTKSPLKSVN